MADVPLDRIHIRDLTARCIIGVNPEERREKQEVVVNITLFADLNKAARTDRIEDTVDYKALKKDVIEAVEGSDYFLIERLAERVAAICLERPIERVEVSVDKPGALRFARSVAVTLTRAKAAGPAK